MSGAGPANRSTVVGLIADTHGLLRPEIARIFQNVSLILHAGDVGGASILADLAKLAPTEAVYGNVDDPHDPMLARERSVVIDGVSVHVSHGHEVGSPTPAVLFSRYKANVIVFGHTHKAVVERAADGRLAINPGAAGPRRFDLKPSVALLTIEGGRPRVDIISLA